jgi:transposase, IS30 family
VARRRVPQRNLPRARRREPRSAGGPPLVAKRELYIALMAKGTNNSAACRLVGVNRKTGTRWSNGRRFVTPDGRVHQYEAITGPPSAVRCRFGALPVRAGAGNHR